MTDNIRFILVIGKTATLLFISRLETMLEDFHADC